VLGSITSDVAEAFYGDIPQEIANQAMHALTPQMRDVVVKFYDKYQPSETIVIAYRRATIFVAEGNNNEH
jgi:hypothetical protein